MLSQGARLADPALLEQIRPGFPIYILVGERDPLGTNLGKVAPLVERYRTAALDVELASYPEGRHEILNERNRLEVVGGLRAWMNIVIADSKS